MTPLAELGVSLIVVLGMLVIVPIGLRLIDDPQFDAVRRVWWLGAVPGAVSLWLPRGALATALATVYLLPTAVLAGHAAARLRHRRSRAPQEIAILTALACPAVGASALVAERAGHPLFGFTLDILALTSPHLLFAGFAASLVAGLVCAAGDSRPARFAALTVPAGTLLVLVGHFVGNLVELVGTVLLTAGMWVAGAITWRDLRPGAPDRGSRLLLGVSAVTLVASMLLALSWAVGRAFDLPHLSLSWMVATHGVANALGFGLCSVLAWTRLRSACADPAAARRDRTPGTGGLESASTRA